MSKNAGLGQAHPEKQLAVKVLNDVQKPRLTSVRSEPGPRAIAAKRATPDESGGVECVDNEWTMTRRGSVLADPMERSTYSTEIRHDGRGVVPWEKNKIRETWKGYLDNMLNVATQGLVGDGVPTEDCKYAVVISSHQGSHSL